MIHIHPADPRPIWSQIEEGMRHLVASGTLSSGAGVPSVRDLARELQVNPATVSKAYQQLVTQGLFEVRRGDGTYVAETPPSLAQTARDRALAEAARRYATTALDLGANRPAALAQVDAAWQQLSKPTTPTNEDAGP